jgi:lambda family phage minor tail protein L
MPYLINTNATFGGEQSKLEGSYPLDLYVVNASLSGWEPLYYAHLNQNVYGWALNATGDTTTTATLYTGIPVERDPIGTNTQGEISEVTLTIPNVDRLIEAIIQTKDYLRGREVHFLSCFAKHLPQGSTAYHLGITEDKNAVLKEKLYIDSVYSDEKVVKFTCRSKFNIKNVIIPRRTFARSCSWALQGKYLATECDLNNTINTASYPTCDGTLDNCRERRNSARYGGFPAIPERGFVII